MLNNSKVNHRASYKFGLRRCLIQAQTFFKHSIYYHDSFDFFKKKLNGNVHGKKVM